MRRPLLCSIVVLASCAPAAELPKPTTSPVAPRPPPAAVASHARWIFDGRQPSVVGELDVGDGTLLQVGEHGRRWLMPRDEKLPVRHSEWVIPEDLRDVRREGEKYLFVGSRGGVFVSDAPLGIAKRVGTSFDVALDMAAGRRAVLGVQRDGSLHRSTDLGVTWSKSKLPLQDGDVVTGIAANTRGEVLVLLRPQRVLFSSDDGATWSSLGTPGIGAQAVTRDAKGDLWLIGAMVDTRAKLLGGPARLEVATGYSGPVRRKAPTEKGGDGAEKVSRTLVGDRVVRTRTKTGSTTEIAISISTLQGDPGPWHPLADASPSDAVMLSGYDDVVVAAVEAKDAIAVSRTADGGKTWESLGKVAELKTYGNRVFALPGWTAVTGVCRQKGCDNGRFTVDGKNWQSLGIDPSAFARHAFYDKARDRVLVLAESDRQTIVYAGKRDAALKPVDVKLPPGFVIAAALDDGGTLRIATRELTSAPLHIEKVSSELKLETPIHLPFEAEYMRLVGSRGFAESRDRAWETADGGEHWTETGFGGGVRACAPSGCMDDGKLRIGWDLPDPAKPLLAATTTPPAEHHPTPQPPAPTPGSIAVSCKISGGWKSYAGMGSNPDVGLDGGVRLSMPVLAKDAEDPHAIRVVRGGAAPQLVNLLPAVKHKDGVAVRQSWWADAAGVVSVRYSYVSLGSGFGVVKGKKYNPVDVDLAWYSAGSGKTHKASLAKVSPFRVGNGPSALVAIVEGGLLFLADGGDSPLYFVHDDGKVETMSRPPAPYSVGFEGAVRANGRVIVAQSSDDSIALISSVDAGKTWTTTVWSFTKPPSLVTIGGKPAIAFYDWRTVLGVVPFDAITNDPPPAAWTTRPFELLSSNKLVACPGAAANGLRMELDENGDASTVVATITAAGKKPIVVQTTTGVLRIRSDGSACTDLVTGDGDDDDGTRLYLSPADPTHAWLVRAQNGGRLVGIGGAKAKPAGEPRFDIAPATCTLP